MRFLRCFCARFPAFNFRVYFYDITTQTLSMCFLTRSMNAQRFTCGFSGACSPGSHALSRCRFQAPSAQTPSLVPCTTLSVLPRKPSIVRTPCSTLHDVLCSASTDAAAYLFRMPLRLAYSSHVSKRMLSRVKSMLCFSASMSMALSQSIRLPKTSGMFMTSKNHW